MTDNKVESIQDHAKLRSFIKEVLEAGIAMRKEGRIMNVDIHDTMLQFHYRFNELFPRNKR